MLQSVLYIMISTINLYMFLVLIHLASLEDISRDDIISLKHLPLSYHKMPDKKVGKYSKVLFPLKMMIGIVYNDDFAYFRRTCEKMDCQESGESRGIGLICRG